MIKIKNHAGRFSSDRYVPPEMIIDPKSIKGISVLIKSTDKEALFLITAEGFGSIFVNEADKDKIVRILLLIHEGEDYQFEKL